MNMNQSMRGKKLTRKKVEKNANFVIKIAETEQKDEIKHGNSPSNPSDTHEI